MDTTIKLSENEKIVLTFLAQNYYEDGNCFTFKGVADGSGLDEKLVRRTVRALARKELTEYARGLFDEDGMVAGSGYCCTRKGHELIEAMEKERRAKEQRKRAQLSLFYMQGLKKLAVDFTKAICDAIGLDSSGILSSVVASFTTQVAKYAQLQERQRCQELIAVRMLTITEGKEREKKSAYEELFDIREEISSGTTV